MVKFHESTFSHAHPFETVALAYFLRYPNPYSTHVLSTDTVARHFDPATQTLYTARLHLKRSRVPAALLRLLPRAWLGASAEGTSQSLVLERSVVAMRDGVMLTESRNLDLTAVLRVVERQLYRRPSTDIPRFLADTWPRLARQQGFGLAVPSARAMQSPAPAPDADETQVATKVEIVSCLGDGGDVAGSDAAPDTPRRRFWWPRRAAAPAPSTDERPLPPPPLPTTTSDAAAAPPEPAAPGKATGLLRMLGTASLRKTIEAIGLRRTERAVPNSKKGMNVVLERLRHGGLVAVLEGMRRDREGVGAVAGGAPEE